MIRFLPVKVDPSYIQRPNTIPRRTSRISPTPNPQLTHALTPNIPRRPELLSRSKRRNGSRTRSRTKCPGGNAEHRERDCG